MFDGFGAWIVAGLTALTSLAPNVAHAQPAGAPVRCRPSSATGVDAHPPPMAHSTAAVPRREPGWETVQAAESIEMFAARTLGSADRWPEVWELNQGRTMDDGATFSQPWKLHAGWQLELPAAAPRRRRRTQQRPVSPHHPSPARYRPAEEVVVADDDNLWNLSLARLRSVGAPDDDVAVAQLVNEVVSLNPSIDDPNLIYTGQRIVMPAVGTPPVDTRRSPGDRRPRIAAGADHPGGADSHHRLRRHVVGHPRSRRTATSTCRSSTTSPTTTSSPIPTTSRSAR